MLENSAFIGLSHQMVLLRQMDVIANNMANLSTTAYRGERPIFEEFLVPTSAGTVVSYVQDVGLLRNTSEGAMLPTGNSLDVAISGKGFFVVETAQGERYTRNGHWQLDNEGQIVETSGNPILDDDNKPIVIDVTDGVITISGDGSISGRNGMIARLQVVRFENEQSLKKTGASLYSRGDQAKVDPEEYSVLQGMLEGSNVKGISEMTRMMTMTQNYSRSNKMMEKNHEMVRNGVERLGKVVSA